MAHMPEIKAEINKEPQKEKKKGGLLPRLFGGGTGAGSVGGGAFGGAAGGGMLATKAGMLALVLVGTTVAGGVGLIGYRLFGPGQDSGNSDNLQLFAAKPKEGGSADSQNAAPKDGASQSLTMVTQANTPPKEPELKPAEAPKDETAANAAAAGGAEAAGGDKGPINAAGSSGNGVNKNLLKTGNKFGELSKNMGGGGGSSAFSGGGSGAKTSAGDAAALASKNGALSAMKHGPAMAGGTSRAIASRRGSNAAMKQALAVLSDNRGATTSYGAGRTYDGSAAANSGNIGPTGGDIGMGGAGDTTGSQPKSMPNTANQTKEFKAPPDPKSVDAAPWQNAINTARLLIGIAAALLLVGKLLSKTTYGKIAAMIIAAMVGVIGTMVIALGAQISSGQYGQKAQGGILAAAGVGLLIAAAATAFGGDDNVKNQDGVSDTGAVSGLNTTGSIADSGKDAGFFSGVNTWVLIGGGLALASMVGSYMAPIQKYPSKDFQNGKPPDAKFFGYQEPPSEKALKTMVG